MGPRRRQSPIARNSPRLSTFRDSGRPTIITEKTPASTLNSETGEWEEPAIRTPAPSFEDYRNGERAGVLVDQQPLGQLPSAAYRRKHEVTSSSLSLARTGRATPVQGVQSETPKAPILTPTPALELDERITTPRITPSPIKAECQGTSSGDTINSSEGPSPAVSKPLANELQSPLSPSTLPPSTLLAIEPRRHSTINLPPVPLPNGFHVFYGMKSQEKLRDEMENTIRRLDRTDPGQAAGMRSLRMDCEQDAKLWKVLDGISDRRPDPEHLKIFRGYIRRGEKAYRKTQISRSTAALLNKPNSGITPSLNSPHLVTQTPLLGSPNNRSSTHDSLQSLPTLSQVSNIHSPVNMASIKQNGGDFTSVNSQHDDQTPEVVGAHTVRARSTSSSLSSAQSMDEDEDTFAPVVRPRRQVNGTPTKRRKPTLGERRAAAHKSGGKKSQGPRKGIFVHDRLGGKRDSIPKNQQDVGSDAQINIEELKREFRRGQAFHEDYLGKFYLGESHERSAPAPVQLVLPQQPSIRGPQVHLRSVVNRAVKIAEPGPEPERTIKKRCRYDSETTEEDLSPPPPPPGRLLVPSPPLAARSSRSSSPRGTRKPPAKRQKTARVMISPNKPKDGRVMAGRVRPVPYYDADEATNSNQEDNNDFCGACEGNGRLLCCDSCPNSFHFQCLDPPMRSEPEGSWYCAQCVDRRHSGEVHIGGMLGNVVKRMRTTNPKTYGLPDAVQNTYQNIRVNPEGRFEEFSLPRTQTIDPKILQAKQNGPVPLELYQEIQDSKGKTIICHGCRLAANGKRLMLPCDYCPAWWHFSCLDPPLTAPPRRATGDKPNATWTCPLHHEQDLRNMGNGESALRGPHPRKRIQKVPAIVDVTLSRGFKNDGRIMVELEPDPAPDSDETETEPEDLENPGTIYRLPEKGIKLDFLDRIRKTREDDAANQRIRSVDYRAQSSHDIHASSAVNHTSDNATLSPDNTAAEVKLRSKSIREQQAVLSLQSLGQSLGADSAQVSGDTIADLTKRLVLDAPDAVMTLEEKDELAQLEALTDLAQKRMKLLQSRQPTSPARSSTMASASTLPAAADNLTPTVRKSGRERRSTSRGFPSLIANGSKPGGGRSLSHGRVEKKQRTSRSREAF